MGLSLVRSSKSYFLYSNIVLEWSQLGGVMPVTVIVWKSWNTASWNSCGMCLISALGILSGPGALWIRSRRRASLKMAGGEFAYDHVLGRRRGSWNNVYPRERAARIDTGIGREGGGIYFFHDSYSLCRVTRYESHVGVPKCR